MNNENRQHDLFETSDFYLAAFCSAKEMKLINLNKDNPKRIVFIFENLKDKDRLVKDFLFGRAKVEPQAFVAAIKELKQLLRSVTS